MIVFFFIVICGKWVFVSLILNLDFVIYKKYVFFFLILLNWRDNFKKKNVEFYYWFIKFFIMIGLVLIFVEIFVW